MKDWVGKNRFPILLGIGLVIFEMIFFGLLWLSAPNGQQWLGDSISNSSDLAVYLSYLKQGSQGHMLLGNLYATEPHALRFDPYWSVLGLLARSGMDARLLHEISRWLASVLLVFVLYVAAKDLTRSEKHARWTTVLSLLGLNAGWLYTIWIYFFGVWRWKTETAADVSTEFSAFYILLGGSHMILSLALLICGLRWSWQAISQSSMRQAWKAALVSAYLFSFHPYFIALFGIYFLIALHQHRKTLGMKNIVRFSAVLSTSLIPAFIIYAPLVFDKVFATHHLEDNQLGLSPALSWVATLLPTAIALAWRWKKRIAFRNEERWILAWIGASVFCLLLPLPWKRKVTEGWSVALLYLGLPLWLTIGDWAASRRPKFMAWIMSGLMFVAASFGAFHLVTTQLSWIKAPEWKIYFYRPESVFAAWRYLENKDGRAIITADNFWINCWTPPYTGKTTWVGHDHESPDFKNKYGLWQRLTETRDGKEAQDILEQAGVTDLMITSEDSLDRFTELLPKDEWRPVFTQDQVTVLERD
ncbi:hypothetical protein HZC53_01100 [Candidatus Uhrbacteria bacterium]|nr:hypothetical protein [Candidatus Uhrbacteria bacterium]